MGQFINSTLMFLSDLGYLGIAIALMIEVIPSEIVLAYGGFQVSQGKMGFVGAVIAGTIGGTIAQLFLYWIGFYGGRPFIERYGKYLLIHKKQLDMAENWFDKYGSGVIFAARFVPVVRHAISVPAGVARMPIANFLLYTLLAMIPWSILFIYLGYHLGGRWEEIHEISKPYLQPAFVAAAVVLVLYILFIKRRSFRKRP